MRTHPKEEIAKTSIDLNMSLVNEAKKAAIDRGVTFRTAVETGLRNWLGSAESHGEREIAVPTRYARDAERLARALLAVEDDADKLVRMTVQRIDLDIRWLEERIAEKGTKVRQVPK